MGLIWIRGVEAKVLAVNRGDPVFVCIEPVAWVRIRRALNVIMERELENEESGGID